MLKATHLMDERRRRAENTTHEHGAGWVRVLEDASRIHDRVKPGCQVIIVVTHADLDPDYRRMDRAEYREHFKPLIIEMEGNMGRGPGGVSTVIGSLATSSDAHGLAHDVTTEARAWRLRCGSSTANMRTAGRRSPGLTTGCRAQARPISS
ncbi:hypothetical protein FAF44_44580 [Nonomuraea sp. MG754425]|uniref:hypothetical protein n=1 Tax=Nonomuraea sp. MG754425 TaxID=2570319 RepID=UPI001F1AE716|nr:hypothetical protein [Nonomuraea sp. MG754425]MCF6475389.1 hypothetical protein [Nonomuraea sp. MG754425]